MPDFFGSLLWSVIGNWFTQAVSFRQAQRWAASVWDSLRRVGAEQEPPRLRCSVRRRRRNAEKLLSWFGVAARAGLASLYVGVPLWGLRTFAPDNFWRALVMATPLSVVLWRLTVVPAVPILRLVNQCEPVTRQRWLGLRLAGYVGGLCVCSGLLLHFVRGVALGEGIFRAFSCTVMAGGVAIAGSRHAA